jgi:glutamate dehydrogenase (NAD(P)+)
MRAWQSEQIRSRDGVVHTKHGRSGADVPWAATAAGASAAPLAAALGGIPLDEIGATGWGVLHAAEAAASHYALDLKGARV